MKYGIALRDDADGSYTYLESSRSWTFGTDITEMALYVQEESAAEQVRAFRRDGGEGEGFTFVVIGTEYVAAKIVEVPRPKVKKGFALKTPDGQYFIGPKKPTNEAVYQLHYVLGVVNRAAAFKTEDEALHRKFKIVTMLEDEIERFRALENGNWELGHFRGYITRAAGDYHSHEEYNAAYTKFYDAERQRRIDTLQELLKKINSLTLIQL